LRAYEVPTILVHADCLPYYSWPPVLANIVPDQERIGEQLLSWLRERGFLKSGRPSRRKRRAEVVVVAMPKEDTVPFSSSIRNRRIELLMSALEPFGPALVTVDDYSFRHAARVLEEHPEARVYVCLCDEIAVAIKHLLTVADREEGRIVIGFDNSELARQSAVPSFCQGLDTIGPLVTDIMAGWFAQAWDSPDRHSLEARRSEFQEKFTPVTLEGG